jgi:hypothetical protein
MSALHRHRFGGQTLTHDHLHDAPHGYFGHPEDNVAEDRAVSLDPDILPGTYERIDTSTPDGLRQWYIHVAGADPTCTMIRRDEVRVGDVVHSSHSGRRRVTSASTRGVNPPGTTYMVLEGSRFPEANPGDSLIPLIERHTGEQTLRNAPIDESVVHLTPRPDPLSEGDREYLQALIDIDNGANVDEYGADTDRINTYLNALEVAK